MAVNESSAVAQGAQVTWQPQLAGHSRLWAVQPNSVGQSPKASAAPDVRCEPKRKSLK
jgi:hypothetical protein